jgi:hypothetical protein
VKVTMRGGWIDAVDVDAAWKRDALAGILV